MNYLNHRYILAAIDGLRAGKSWTSRTHVQKALYLAKALSVPDVPFTFVLYRHGPYSFDVDSELDEMISYSAVRVIPQEPYGPSLAPDKGRVFPENAVILAESHLDQVQQFASRLGGRGVRELEALATSVWIIKEEHKNAQEAILSRLLVLKPHLDRNSATTGVKDAMQMVGSPA